MTLGTLNVSILSPDSLHHLGGVNPLVALPHFRRYLVLSVSDLTTPVWSKSSSFFPLLASASACLVFEVGSK